MEEYVPDGGRPSQWKGSDRYSYEYHAYSNWLIKFGGNWQDIGRPFKKCVYCEAHHFVPVDLKKEKYVPCTAERFVRGIIYSFPILRRDAPGLTPWKPLKWAKWWRTSGAQTSGSYHAVAFVLSVWSGSGKEWIRRGYVFDVVRAFGCWDEGQRGAFRAWTQNPWWP